MKTTHKQMLEFLLIIQRLVRKHCTDLHFSVSTQFKESERVLSYISVHVTIYNFNSNTIKYSRSFSFYIVNDINENNTIIHNKYDSFLIEPPKSFQKNYFALVSINLALLITSSGSFIPNCSSVCLFTAISTVSDILYGKSDGFFPSFKISAAIFPASFPNW